VLVSQTVHGNLIVGPNASIDVRDKDDVSTKAEALAFVREKAVLSVPSINFRENIRNFSGERATIVGLDDFVIGESKEVKNFINFAGIKSPGLSCAPSFGVEAIKILSELGLSLEKKDDFVLSPLNTYFKDLPEEEKIKKIQENKDYGQIICRCETVSLGEIKDALHRIIPATSIDGVKRRTNAGMGRCQGGFCGPKVLEIIEQELHIKPDHINQDREGSFIIEAFTKGDK
ncbi:MAG: (2Fe-2S)-binding protein, partial [Bacilli bacterium]|nr:(2Fe-2S)-binding protein [Bacilli bacterium]MDY5898430.1 (2Fe-2S)-binding protein [Bacilli bacterium]